MPNEEKKPCCEPADGKPSSSSCCCSSQASSSSCGPSSGGDCCAPGLGGKSRWKLVLFVLVLGAALVVLICGLVKKPAQSAPVSQGSFSSVLDGQGEAPAPQRTAVLDSVASLEKVAADQEAVFILLTAGEAQSDQKALQEVQGAVQALTGKGRRVAAFTMEKSAPDHEKLVQRLSLANLPSVVVVVRGCGATAVSGEINEAKLLQAFIAASTPASSCGPSGCGPSGCN